MRTLVLILIVMLLGGQSTTMAHKPQGTIKYGEVKAKVISGPDSDGDIWFSLKVEVRNDGTREKYVSITVRGVDADGFEIVDTSMSGSVKPGERRDFTDSTYVNYKAYQSVVKWEVEQ